ncbi:hypothetical protein BN946_scf185014.g26 [Trametes cinnabarina]|uniref:Uncharacterized protein n=1 Tax=Pycnoporus cinnabarinus TaxID=5643 RepID=A0A060SH73_PYCCI|nr:hypothetical protein BN946_scf185014.g26 [Trametes cinnabarina]
MPVLQPRPTAGSTHVGGILPSASFFHPSRPHNAPPSPPPPLPRPSTVGSISSVAGTPADVVRLAALNRDRISEGTDSAEHSMEDIKASALAPSLRNASTKYSREPLLPIGGGPSAKSNDASRPTLQIGPYGRSESNVSAGGRMRDSFDKLFKRGFSFDASRRSPTSPISAGPSGAFGALQPRSAEISPVTFDLHVGGTDHSPTSQGHRKHSLSPLQGSSTSLNHASFMATPPSNMDPPLSAVPILDSRTGKPMRNYQLHPSRNRFFLGGRLLTGGDSPWAFVASLTVVLGITGVWFGTTCVWWWLNESPAVAAVGAYMCLLTISSMFATAFRDPGILPRNLDPDPPYPAGSSSDGSLRQPLPRDLRVMTLILVICTTALHLYLLTRKFHMSFGQAIGTSQGIGSAVAFCISILVIWPVLALLSYHLRIRNQAHKSLVPGPPPPNPFSHGNWWRNLVYMLCRPPGYSWLDARGIATEDKRQVNPGLLPREDEWTDDVESPAVGNGRGKGE